MAIRKKQKALSSGRPPVAKSGERMSSKQTRTIIRTHHRLQKEQAAALKKGDIQKAEEIQKAIEQNGGIKLYQAASKLGQSKTRGGDSSKVLVEWLQQMGALKIVPKTPHRLLEVGALSTENEISKYPKIINMTRIDLNSQGPGIEQQDFMERPLPASRDDMFDIISLSLVLNYVPEPVGRGEMLKRLTKFLRLPQESPEHEADGTPLPALFFVLPLPCVANSRYLDEENLLGIMADLGFEVLKKKDTSKLCYYLFQWSGQITRRKTPKRLIRDKAGMNNFCIVVD
ncbi:hypothetical protein M011DRAFT_474558 [Sporormia fimetaria CBS 119925]|uniref:25S rRNA adenine-N(1) methyltransferase n=1 Tax=Sporormia fimetaria CBS 119925 TaxID=1340428 RepID=A0A6A6VLR1_9PLEO|nr:hypothetical protein M011DRAFT_474558 [Sporormia fimetaria CBS 119925]